MSDEELAISFAEYNTWTPIPRISRVIPFGYTEDPEDPNLLQPVVLELEALQIAKKHLKIYSSRKVAEWLSHVTGREISHVGLRKRVAIERSRRTKAQALRNWTKRNEKTQAIIDRYETQRTGAK